MLNVLVVEDEMLTRKTITNFVNNSNMPVSSVYEAFNGKKALEIMRKHDIHLVLTDIKMPELDGIEFVKQAVQEYPESEFYVISGYDEFDIVSNAFKHKVKDYILKTDLSQQHVTNALNSTIVSNKARQQRKLSENKDRFISHFFYEKEHSIKEAILKRMLDTPAISPEEHAAAVVEFPALFASKNLCMMALQISGLQGEHDTRRAAITNSIAHLQSSTPSFEAVWHENRLVLFVNLEGSCSNSKCNDAVHSLFSQIKTAVCSSHGLAVSGGVCIDRFDHTHIAALYQKSIVALQFSFFSGLEKLISYDGIVNEHLAQSSFNEAPYVSSLMHLLQTATADEISAQAEPLYVKPATYCYKDIAIIRALFAKYFMYLHDFVKSKWYASMFDDLFAAYSNTLRDTGTLSELNGWVQKVLTLIAEQINGDGQIIGKAKKYIKNNFGRRITIEEVAESLGISSNYLSRLFCKNENCSFIDYVANVRIGAAIDLMRSSNLKLYEISSQVGFLNAETFSRAFKRITGKSPSEYFG